MSGPLDGDGHLALYLGGVASFAAADNLAPLVDAAPESGHVLVIDNFIVKKDRLAPAASAEPATGPRTTPAGAAASLLAGAETGAWGRAVAAGTTPGAGSAFTNATVRAGTALGSFGSFAWPLVCIVHECLS
jgi:hypothetical protein